MNSVVLMCEIVQKQSVRNTNQQNPIGEMLVKFYNKNDENGNLVKVTTWGNIITQCEDYREGDNLIVQGSLNLYTVDLGSHNEKKLEINAQKITKLGNNKSGNNRPKQSDSDSSKVVNMKSKKTTINKTPVESVEYDPVPF